MALKPRQRAPITTAVAELRLGWATARDRLHSQEPMDLSPDNDTMRA